MKICGMDQKYKRRNIISNDLGFYLTNPEKKEQMKPKINTG